MKSVTQKVSVIVDGKTVAIEPAEHPTGKPCEFDLPTTLDEALDMFGEGKILDFIERQYTQDVANKYRVEYKDARENPLKSERIALMAELKSTTLTPARAMEVAKRLAVIGFK